MSSPDSSLESIHSILTSISSHATDLAVNAVHYLIEDQVVDPVKLESNIARVKSVFFPPAGDGRGDIGPCTEKLLLLKLPQALRQNIWNYLDDKSVKTLRLVCEQLRYEMDYDVGLGIFLKMDSFNSLWMRSISIRSCVIKQMDSILALNNFACPEKLERIYFDSEVQVNADMIELIIRKFLNLRQILVYTEDTLILKDVHEEAIPNNNSSSKIILRLEDQFRLVSIDVKFDTSKWKLKWNIKLKPQNYDKSWYQVQIVPGSFGQSGIAPVSRDISRKTLKTVTLSIPFVQDRDHFVWLSILQSQNVLSSLTCDLNATHWKDYEKIITASQKTLTKIFLLNITNSAKRYSGKPPEEEDSPFDWKMFQYCNVLKEITLIAETFLHSSATKFSPSNSDIDAKPKVRRYIPSINLALLQCPMLTAVWLENFKFTEMEMAFLKKGEKDKARFELCTLKNCMSGEEEISEMHLGVRRERNRSLECLCFGTTHYDEDELESFEKYTSEKIEEKVAKQKSYSFPIDFDVDMMECLQLRSGSDEDEDRTDVATFISDNMNIIGGIAFTLWLYYS